MTNCISLSENLRPSPATVPPARRWHAKKMAAASHRPIKTQTVLCNGVYSIQRQQQMQPGECVQEIDRLDPDCTRLSRTLPHIQTLRLNPQSFWGNLGEYFSRDGPCSFFSFPSSVVIRAGELIWVCAVFLNNNLIHIRTATLAHTWELQSTNAVCCRRASEGKLEEEEASFTVPHPESPDGPGGGVKPAVPAGYRCEGCSSRWRTTRCEDRQQADRRQNHKLLSSFLCFAWNCKINSALFKKSSDVSEPNEQNRS